MSVRVRFAPSPTGYLHIGNVRTALFNYLFAKSNNGKFIVRIEDTDKERSKSEYVEQIFNDLRWLGLLWDEGPDIGGDKGPYEQSKRLEFHLKAVDKLVSEGNAYPCFCTPEVLDQVKKESQAKGLPPRYDNRCSKLSAEEVNEKKTQGLKFAIRFKIDQPEVQFKDLVRGEVKFDMNLFGDFIIVRPDGSPTFHLAVCYDDGAMGITHVLRGEDHLANTPRHILLTKALGFEPPQYAHLSLITSRGGEPLSKRSGAKSIEEYKKLGYTPEVVDNYLSLLGWSPGDDREIFSLEQLEKEFSLKRVGKSSATFDVEKFDWLSGEHIRRFTDEEYVEKATQYLKEQNLIPEFLKSSESLLNQILLIFKDNITRFEELTDRLSIYDPNSPIQDEFVLKQEGVSEIIQTVRGYIQSLGAEEAMDFSQLNTTLKESVSKKGKELYLPLRVGLTFRSHGPEMKRILPFLDKQLCLKRLEEAEKLTQ